LHWIDSDENVISIANPYVVTVLSDTLLIAIFEEYDSIEESIKFGLVSISPNPATDIFTVSFDVLKSNNLKITINDLSGRELFTVYDDFTVEGFFTRTFSTKNLPTGIYFLQILIDGKYTVAKVVVE